jgi:ribosomal protein S27E
MAIAFKCPSCQHAYKVKEDMAGKKVVCTDCKKPIRVPAAYAASSSPLSAEADALAAAALADAPPAPAETAAATITVECPNCIEQVTFSSDKAGKQAPCPSCGRIIRVPIPKTGKADWRTADARPTFAKVQSEADLKDVVSTANIKVVDREALAEAGALRKRQRELRPLRERIRFWIIVGCLASLGVVGVLLFRGKRVTEQRGDLVKSAVRLVADNANLPAGIRAETYRAAAEYVLAQPDGKAEAARENLANARGALTNKGTEQPFEKTALLTRIAVTTTGLVGGKDDLRNGRRFELDKMLTELRRTLAALDNDPGQWEGNILAVRELTHVLGLSGESAIVGQVHGRFDTPATKADALATVGLELLGTGEEGEKKAKELAEQVKAMNETNQPRVVALLAATKLSDPAMTDSPPLAVRLGAAEGFARRGDLDAARAIARKPGSPEDRFQALVTLAEVQPAGQSADAVSFFADEFKNRDLPDWPLIRLAQICANAPSPEPAKSLAAALAGLKDLAPRSAAVRAWAQMELLRSSGEAAPEAAARAITPDTTLGARLAWEEVARRTRNPDAAPDPARPLALVGTALGSLK